MSIFSFLSNEFIKNEYKGYFIINKIKRIIIMNSILVKRLTRDIKEIQKNPIENIYYIPDESNISNGYAMIIGHEDTPYAYGYYFFEFQFPDNYPFSPPKVVFYTNDGKTRLNPNFYISGKVCLSVLNTWKGEGWTSCQSIRSILLILSTTLNDKPLLNEPGLTEKHRDFENYQNMICYKNIDTAIIGMLNHRYFNEKFEIFKDIIHDTFRKNRVNITTNAIKLQDKIENNTIIAFGLYSSRYLVDFDTMINCLKSLE